MAEELIRLHGIDRLRAIVVSHSHHDHVMDAPYLSLRCGAELYGSASTLNVARGGGVPEERLHAFSGGERLELGGFRVTVIPSLHSKPTLLNNDLGQTIDRPLRQPARLRDYKEGGSFDFLVEGGGRRCLIRPSFNYIEGQLDGVQAELLFLGVAGLAKADQATRARFFAETVDKVKPELVIPLHWDNFFRPLDRPARGMPRSSSGPSCPFTDWRAAARSVASTASFSSPGPLWSSEAAGGRQQKEAPGDGARCAPSLFPSAAGANLKNSEICAPGLPFFRRRAIMTSSQKKKQFWEDNCHENEKMDRRRRGACDAAGACRLRSDRRGRADRQPLAR